MHIKTFIMSLGLLALLAASPPVEAKAGEQDNAILAQVLQRQKEGGGFIVVSPTTAFGRREPHAAWLKKSLNDKLGIEGYDIGPLVNKLIEKNKKPSHLSLKSSPEKGYIVDHNGKFEKYFDQNGGGWQKWHKDNPAAHGWTRVSMPAYDEQAGIVLVYIGTQSDRLAGAGYIVAYSYKDGKLKELGRVLLWVS